MSEAFLSPPDERPQPARFWQVWSVAKQELLYLSWALMEIALLTPVVLSFMRWTRFWPESSVTLWLLLLLLLPFNLIRLLSALQSGKKFQRRFLVGAFLLTIFFTWRTLLFNSLGLFDFSWLADLFLNIGNASSLWARTLILFLLILFTWWRGLRLLQFTPDLDRAGLRLRAGTLLFVPIILLPRSGGDAWGILPYVLLYFLAGLTTVALIRAEQIERERSGFAASLSPRWVGTIIAVSLLVVFAAALVAILIAGEPLVIVMQWLAPLRMAVLAGTSVALITALFLASPFFVILEIFLTWLSNFFAAVFAGFGDNLGLDPGAFLNNLNNFLPIWEEDTEIIGFSIPAEVSRGLIILVMLVLVILVSYSLTRRFRQPPLTSQKEGPVRASGGRRLESEGIGQRILERLGILRRWRTAASIRQLYQAMCDHAASFGYARAASETPYEYLDTLAEIWPFNREDARLITEAFIRARYGEVPETEQELQAIRAAWRRLEESDPVELRARRD